MYRFSGNKTISIFWFYQQLLKVLTSTHLSPPWQPNVNLYPGLRSLGYKLLVIAGPKPCHIYYLTLNGDFFFLVFNILYAIYLGLLLLTTPGKRLGKKFHVFQREQFRIMLLRSTQYQNKQAMNIT